MARRKTLLEVFSMNLKFWRKTNGFTQKQLATKAGVHVSYVSMLERGTRSPPLETVEKFSVALRVKAAGLLLE